jgi:transposase
MAYSIDFRAKAVEYKDKGHTFAELKEAYGIDNKTYAKWKRLYAETQSYKDKKRRSRGGKIAMDKLLQNVKKKPDSYLKELAKPFGCTPTAVFYALRWGNITYKKNFHV